MDILEPGNQGSSHSLKKSPRGYEKNPHNPYHSALKQNIQII